MSWQDAALPLIREFEGLRLDAYRDSAGVWTIGYGHTEGVQPGDRITEAEAERLLRYDLARHAEPVDRLVKVHLNDNEKAALASFVFNLGGRAFATSTLLRKLNANDRQGAADEFPRWVYAGGEKLRGLERRRRAERDLFINPPAPSLIPQLPKMSVAEIESTIIRLQQELGRRLKG